MKRVENAQKAIYMRCNVEPFPFSKDRTSNEYIDKISNRIKLCIDRYYWIIEKKKIRRFGNSKKKLVRI